LIAAARATAPNLGALLVVAATTGARRGELCGLRWSDLDRDAGQLDIVRSVIIVGGECRVAPTKSRQCRRVAIDVQTLGTHAEHRQRADKRAADAGTAVGDEAFMFSGDPDGARPLRPDSTSRAFARLCREVGLDHVRFHDLRHYVATRLLAVGVDLRTVAGRLGHSKAGTTLNVYAAFLPDADHRAAEVMASLLVANVGDDNPIASGATTPIQLPIPPPS
jgi:integrase